jgi:hypothetical protein
MRSKDLPISVLRTLERFDSKSDKLYNRVIEPSKYLMRFVDSDNESDFYFQITRADKINGDFKYHLSIKPQSEISTDATGFSIGAGQLDLFFNNWVKALAYYESSKVFDKDPIIKQYEQEFFSEFELIDGDADTSTYNLDAQLRIDGFLEQVNEILQNCITEQNAEILEEIQAEVTNLRNTQTSLTKRKVFEAIVNIGARIRKKSLPAFKWFAEAFGKALLGAVAKVVIEGSGIIQKLIAATHNI